MKYSGTAKNGTAKNGTVARAELASGDRVELARRAAVDAPLHVQAQGHHDLVRHRCHVGEVDRRRHEGVQRDLQKHGERVSDH